MELTYEVYDQNRSPMLVTKDWAVAEAEIVVLRTDKGDHCFEVGISRPNWEASASLGWHDDLDGALQGVQDALRNL